MERINVHEPIVKVLLLRCPNELLSVKKRLKVLIYKNFISSANKISQLNLNFLMNFDWYLQFYRINSGQDSHPLYLDNHRIHHKELYHLYTWTYPVCQVGGRQTSPYDPVILDTLKLKFIIIWYNRFLIFIVKKIILIEYFQKKLLSMSA